MADPLLSGDWSPERLERVGRLVLDLYGIIDEFNEEFAAENKRFTPDGVLVGHLGEVLAAYVFDLELLPSSHNTHDARTRSDGTYVQIKFTGGNGAVALRSCPDHLIVLRYHRNELSVVYNGEGEHVWREIADKPLPSNGQRQIRLSRLRTLDEKATGKLPIVRPFPSFIRR